MLTAFDSIPARDRVIVALDCDAWEAIALADKLEGHAKWLKIGMTLYYAEGPAIVKMFKRRGFNVVPRPGSSTTSRHQVQGCRGTSGRGTRHPCTWCGARRARRRATGPTCSPCTPWAAPP